MILLVSKAGPTSFPKNPKIRPASQISDLSSSSSYSHSLLLLLGSSTWWQVEPYHPPWRKLPLPTSRESMPIKTDPKFSNLLWWSNSVYISKSIGFALSIKNGLDSQGMTYPSDTTHSRYIGLHLCSIWPLLPKPHLHCIVSMSGFTIKIILILQVMGLNGGRLCFCSWWKWLFLVAIRIRTPPTCPKKKRSLSTSKEFFFLIWVFCKI